MLEQLSELKQKYVPACYRAIIYVGLGEKDKVIEWLEKGYEERLLTGFVNLPADPIFDPLRSDPRYADLLQRMNLQP